MSAATAKRQDAAGKYQNPGINEARTCDEVGMPDTPRTPRKKAEQPQWLPMTPPKTDFYIGEKKVQEVRRAKRADAALVAEVDYMDEANGRAYDEGWKVGPILGH